MRRGVFELRGVSGGFSSRQGSCLLIDAYLPGMTGLELLRKLRVDGHNLPTIMITGDSDVSMAVEAMKAGATDFIEKPVGREESIASIDRALELSRDANKAPEWRKVAATHLASSRRGSSKSWKRCSPDTPARTLRADSGLANAPSRTIAVNHEANRVQVSARSGSIGFSRLGQVQEEPQQPR